MQETITLQYRRVPQTHKFDAVLTVESETGDAPETINVTYNGVDLLEVITRLHSLLKEHPQARLMFFFTTVSGTQRMHTDSAMRDLIRDNLPAALKLFGPIEIKVDLRKKETNEPRS